MLTNEELDKKILGLEQSEKERIEEEIKKEEERIINSKDSKAIYLFARNVEGSHIDKLEDAIIATGDAGYIYSFAFLDGAHIEKLEDAIIATKKSPKKALYIYEFARDIKGAHIDRLEDAVIATKTVYIYLFARDIKGAHIEKLEDGIIAAGDNLYICEFAKDIKGAHIDKLEDAIIATGDAQYIYEFAKNIKGTHIDKLEDGIIAKGDAYYIYSFAKDIKGAHIDKLEDGIISTKKAQYIYEFAMDIKGAHIDKLRDAIILIGNLEYISKFFKLAYIKADERELYLVLSKRFDLETIGITFADSFANKLYFKKKEDTLKYLIKNRELDINKLRLRIYFDWLNNPNSTKEDLEKCNEEYIRYVSMFYGEKNKNEETKENSEKNNEQGKTLVKTKK